MSRLSLMMCVDNGHKHPTTNTDDNNLIVHFLHLMIYLIPNLDAIYGSLPITEFQAGVRGLSLTSILKSIGYSD